MRELLESSQVRPAIDRRYPLDQTAGAFRYVGIGHNQGIVVITVVHEDET